MVGLSGGSQGRPDHGPVEASSFSVTCRPVVESYEDRMRKGGEAALRSAERFFMRDDEVHRSLRKISARLEEVGIPYAVVGGMALVAHGYRRTTLDVDVLLPAEALPRVHAALGGLGYTPPFEGSRDLRDTETGVRIEFLVAGEFPGDGRPKPVAFPDPARTSVVIDGIRYVGLETLVELKLASGITNPGRIRDLADVQELIRVLGLDAGFVEDLDPYVRSKYLELLAGVSGDRPPRTMG
jgi:hypothetical protein